MRLAVLLTAAAILVASTSEVYAHLGAGVPHHFKVREALKPGSGAFTPVRRAATPAAPTDEPSAATISGAAKECKAYSLPEVVKIKSQFPTVWQTAEIVNGDTQAQQVWNTIQQSGIIPSDVKQKGTGGKGNFTDVTPSYSKTDPDCWYTFDQCVNPKHPQLPQDVWQCAEPDTWGLTFDDGPNCSHNAFYDLLRDNNQKASLFYIGSNVMDWPLEAQRGIVEGHHICVHTWSHQYMTQLTNEEVFAELYYTGKAIKDVTGVTARCWRPPYGDVDDRVRAIAHGLGMSTNVWSDDTSDWKIQPYGTLPTASIEANYNSIINENYDTHGNIVLTHEINGETMKLMEKMYPVIKQHFKHIVPITACMNDTNPYPEAITYPNFASYIGGQVMPSGLPSASSIQVTDATYDPLGAAGGNSTANAKQQSAQGKAKNSASMTHSILHNQTAMLCGLFALVAFMVVA